MANMAMAQAVLANANQFYDVGSWYVVAECCDVYSVLEELERRLELAAATGQGPAASRTLGTAAEERYTHVDAGAQGASEERLTRRGRANGPARRC